MYSPRQVPSCCTIRGESTGLISQEGEFDSHQHDQVLCGCSSVVEFFLAKEDVEGSNPFTRSKQSVEAQRAPQNCTVQSTEDGQPHKLLGCGFDSRLCYQHGCITASGLSHQTVNLAPRKGNRWFESIYTHHSLGCTQQPLIVKHLNSLTTKGILSISMLPCRNWKTGLIQNQDVVGSIPTGSTKYASVV